MANEQMITIRGRLTDEVELRFTPSGSAVANFTIASNARIFDKQTNEWKDKDAIFWRCSAWRELAENAAESLAKGMAVIAYVELESRSYDAKDGTKRTVTEARVESIGPDLRWATAKVTRVQRNGQGGQQQGNNQGGNFGGQQQQQNNGGWNGNQSQPGQPANSNNSNNWGNGPGAEPPF